MKKFLVGVIIILIIPITILSIITYNKYRNSDKKVDKSLETRLLDERNSKQKELDTIKESNKEKVEKYEKVRSWNEEIIYYFD